MCGILGKASSFINSYMSDYDQYIVWDDYKLDVYVNLGVPHGSLLGQLLLIFSLIKFHILE